MSELTDSKPQHRVGVNLGYTRNMGNFESLRLDISLEADGNGHPDETFKRVYSWVEKQLVEKMAEVEKELKD